MSDFDVFDVLIVGAGPAGLAAALAASPHVRVAIVDENAQPGGQIHRATGGRVHQEVQILVEQLDKHGVTRFAGFTVVDAPSPGVLAAHGPTGLMHLGYRKLILAVGARELFLPYPGWTLPNVMGVGGLQALVKAGLDVRGKRIVVAGTGPLLLAVGAYLKDHGAQVPLVLEQARLSSLVKFLGALLPFPAKWGQGAVLSARVGMSMRTGTWVESAHGSERLEWITVRQPYGPVQVSCDYLACAYGFAANLELAMLLGCEIEDGFVKVDDDQRTSVENVFCVGEPTGIGGIDLARIEGLIAGMVATGASNTLSALKRARAKWNRFARALDRAFSLHPALKELADADTVVCRCEDVRLGQLVGFTSGREAKLHTRCGMGPCQGRICGPATRMICDWEHGSVRPPLSPMPISALAEISEGTIKNTD